MIKNAFEEVENGYFTIKYKQLKETLRILIILN